MNLFSLIFILGTILGLLIGLLLSYIINYINVYIKNDKKTWLSKAEGKYWTGTVETLRVDIVYPRNLILGYYLNCIRNCIAC